MCINKRKSPRELLTYWIEEIIIGLDLCPFAKIPYQNGLVRLSLCETIRENEQKDFFLDELDLLQQTSNKILSTSLLAFNNDKKNFEDFNDFVGDCEELLIEAGLEEHFQLVFFHPQFRFENTDPDECSNWVGRSPYPVIHILRNAEIEMSIRHFDFSIPESNKEKLKALSQDDLQKLFFFL